MVDTWLDLSRDCRKAASELVRKDRFRSAAARAYYAVYSKVSYEIVLAGLPFPTNREGPSHHKLKHMIEENLSCLGDRDRRFALSRIVSRLYVLRLDADYRPSILFGAREAREAVSLMNKVFDAF